MSTEENVHNNEISGSSYDLQVSEPLLRTIVMPKCFSPSLRAGGGLGSHTPDILEDTFEKVQRNSEGRWASISS